MHELQTAGWSRRGCFGNGIPRESAYATVCRLGLQPTTSTAASLPDCASKSKTEARHVRRADRGSQLFSAGADFAYGSLFHRSFYWDASAVVLPTLRALQQAGAISSYKHIFNSTYHHSTVSSNYQIPSSLRTDWSAPWIGVHMRHFGAGDDGTRASAISVWWQQVKQRWLCMRDPKPA
eukprot:536408-Pleurochrysis_carterae.AAC.3